MQLVAKKQGQLLDLLRRDYRLGHGETAGEIGNLIREFIPPEPQVY